MRRGRRTVFSPDYARTTPTRVASEGVQPIPLPIFFFCLDLSAAQSGLADQSALPRCKAGGGGAAQGNDAKAQATPAEKSPDPTIWREQAGTFAPTKQRRSQSPSIARSGNNSDFTCCDSNKAFIFLTISGCCRGHVGRLGAVFGQVVQLDLARLLVLGFEAGAS